MKLSNFLWQYLIRLSLIVAGSLILMLAFFIWFRLEIIDIEQRDFELEQQLRLVAHKIEQHQQQTGELPPNLKIIDSEQICTTKIITYCVDVSYRIVDEGRQFRLAAHSLSWPILYYHSELSKQSQRILFAYPASHAESKTDLPLPVYRVSSPEFSHPEEWPQL